MTDELVVRQFQASDTDAVTSLWEEELPSSQPWNDPRQIICRKRQHNDKLFFVGEKDGQIVATVIAGYDGIRGWIYSMAVSSRCRRQGIGRKMLVEAENGLLARRCPKVNLQVRGSNSEVIEFYGRCGYAIEDRASLGKPLRTDSSSIVDPVPTIQVNNDITLSQISLDDRPAYLKHLNETNAFRENMVSMPYPYADIDAEQWLSKVAQETLDHDHCRNWAIRTNSGELIGATGLVGIGRREKAEIGYWLAKPYWGRGIVTEVVGRLCGFAFEEYELRRIYARALTSNPASARVLKKAGFELEGTLRSHVFRDGKSYDVSFFGLMRST
ncbi:MAG: GNAT family acetyltransferase [Planctomycetes bacterium]|nr:GNAT family acetyltransferase [Planctomycetota bacterium]